MNIKKHKKTIMILLGIALLTTLLGCTQTNQEQTKTNTETELTELKQAYSDLHKDAIACFWAIECKENENKCLTNFEGYYANYTAEQISNRFKNICNDLETNWEKYAQYDYALEGVN